MEEEDEGDEEIIEFTEEVVNRLIGIILDEWGVDFSEDDRVLDLLADEIRNAFDDILEDERSRIVSELKENRVSQKLLKENDKVYWVLRRAIPSRGWGFGF